MSNSRYPAGAIFDDRAPYNFKPCLRCDEGKLDDDDCPFCLGTGELDERSEQDAKESHEETTKDRYS